jgi:hypothetical protein
MAMRPQTLCGTATTKSEGRWHPNLSINAKWLSGSIVPNLLQCFITASLYGRIKVDGKIYRPRLDGAVVSSAGYADPTSISWNTSRAHVPYTDKPGQPC